MWFIKGIYKTFMLVPYTIFAVLVMPLSLIQYMGTNGEEYSIAEDLMDKFAKVLCLDC